MNTLIIVGVLALSIYPNGSVNVNNDCCDVVVGLKKNSFLNKKDNF